MKAMGCKENLETKSLIGKTVTVKIKKKSHTTIQTLTNHSYKLVKIEI